LSKNKEGTPFLHSLFLALDAKPASDQPISLSPLRAKVHLSIFRCAVNWLDELFFLFLFIRASDAVPVFFSLPPSFAPLLSWGENRRRGLVFLIPGVAYYSLVTATAKPLGEFFFTFFSRPATHQSIHLTEDMPLPRGLLDGLSIRGRVKEYPLSTLGKAPRTIFLFFCQAAFFFKKFPA